MNKHTPGPWFVNKTPESDGLAVITDGRQGLDALFHIKCEWGEANLVAAAPDLLEALEGMDAYFRSGNSVPVESATIKADSDAARNMKAAIAKARGEG